VPGALVAAGVLVIILITPWLLTYPPEVQAAIDAYHAKQTPLPSPADGPAEF